MTHSIFLADPEPHITRDPVTVAKHIVCRGDWGSDGTEPKVIILDQDDEPDYWFDPDQALEVARRLTQIAIEIKEGHRPLRRLAIVDDRLRGLDG